ncbi:hypothetical protein HAX54_003867 [Datura stramonium]|uniref:Uncharacterized protein n=1 Tax=Datura stramonium TaxID=4076 RepID=A0ABS8WSG7_DATST|nr:hypothetical protein [Datura stramonium]
MQTRGCNRLVIEQDDDDVRQHIEKLMDDQNYSANQPYLEQLIHNQNNAEAQAHDGLSNELNSFIGGDEVQHNDELGTLETRKSRGPTLLKDIRKLPHGKTIVVSFNRCNQSVGKEGRKLASF